MMMIMIESAVPRQLRDSGLDWRLVLPLPALLATADARMGLFGKSAAEKEAETVAAAVSKLLAAAQTGDLAAVREALDAGASLECVTDDMVRPSRRPAAHAPAACPLRCVTAAAKRGWLLTRLRRCAQFGQTPLCLAAEKGQDEVVDLLLKRGALLESLTKHVRGPARCALLAPVGCSWPQR